MVGSLINGGCCPSLGVRGFRRVSPHWKPGRGYHEVNPSPWPFLASVGVYALAMGLIRFCHDKRSMSVIFVVFGATTLGYRFIW